MMERGFEAVLRNGRFGVSNLRIAACLPPLNPRASEENWRRSFIFWRLAFVPVPSFDAI